MADLVISLAVMLAVLLIVLAAMEWLNDRRKYKTLRRRKFKK